MIGGQVHVEGDALVLHDGEAEPGGAGGFTVSLEAVGATEAHGHRGRRGEREGVRVVAEMVPHEGDVVIGQRIEELGHVRRLDAR